MRPLRVRCTVRRLMFVVVAVALALEGIRLQRLSEGYDDLALRHSKAETIVRQDKQNNELMAVTFEKTAQAFVSTGQTEVDFGNERVSLEDIRNHVKNYRDAAARAELRAKYHANLTIKYKKASCRPWLSIEPDGTPPRWP